MFTHMSLPFNYNYSQNPYVRLTGDGGTVNTTAVKHVGYFISANDPIPSGPQQQPDLMDHRMVEIIAQIEETFQDRPVWTRRSMLNHLGGKLRNWNELKKYLNYAAYQFKGGPWRDGVVPYGVDPRTDPKYRIYQTLMFKLPKQKRAKKDQTWQSLRRAQMGPVKEYSQELSESHIFDGETYHTDGKVWQVCDITDPLLRDLLDNAAVRPTWDVSSGWYHGGLWAKVKAIMKTKLLAIQFGRELRRRDFAATLACGDQSPSRTGASTYHLPLPNLQLTDEELTLLRGREPSRKSKHKGYSVRVKDPGKGPEQVAQDLASETPNESAAPEIESENDESGSGSEEDEYTDDEGDPELPTFTAEDMDEEDEGEDDTNTEVYPEPPIFAAEDMDEEDEYEEDMNTGVYPELD